MRLAYSDRVTRGRLQHALQDARFGALRKPKGALGSGIRGQGCDDLLELPFGGWIVADAEELPRQAIGSDWLDAARKWTRRRRRRKYNLTDS
jgi:hypothetical protein